MSDNARWCTREPGDDCTTTCCRCERCELGRQIHDHGMHEEFYSPENNRISLTRHGRTETCNGYMQQYHKSRRLELIEQANTRGWGPAPRTGTWLN